MGLFDTFIDGDRQGQVKCFNNDLMCFQPGNTIPESFYGKTYCIILREGGYACIENNIFIGIKETPLGTIYDKWGVEFSEESKGLLNEPYLLENHK